MFAYLSPALKLFVSDELVITKQNVFINILEPFLCNSSRVRSVLYKKPGIRTHLVSFIYSTSAFSTLSFISETSYQAIALRRSEDHNLRGRGNRKMVALSICEVNG